MKYEEINTIDGGIMTMASIRDGRLENVKRFVDSNPQ